MLHGVTSFQDEATAIWGLAKSSSRMPMARGIAPAGAPSMPGVTSRDRVVMWAVVALVSSCPLTAGQATRVPIRSPHDKALARLAIPSFGALVAEPLYVLADTAVVGRIGTEELAGLAVASSALLTGYAIFIFLAYGTTAAVTRLLGAGQERSAAHQAVQGLWLAGLIGVAVTILVIGFAGPIVDLLGGTGGVRTNALISLRISALGITFQLLTFAGTGYLRGLQDTRTPLLVALGAALANLVIELV